MTVTYSINSPTDIVHFDHCCVVRRIPKTFRCTFDSLEEAVEQGYRLCSCCSPVSRRYHREKKAVDLFCRDSGLGFSVLNDEISVESKHDYWKIVKNPGEKGTKLCLYRDNTLQQFRSVTVMGYLRYIVRYENRRAARNTFAGTNAYTPARTAVM